VFGLTDKHFFLLALLLYGVSMVYSVFLWRRGFREDNRLNYGFLLTGFLLQTGSMFLRGFSLNRCPLTNLYDAMLFVAWTIVAVYLVIGIWSRWRFLGAFASPVIFAMGVFAFTALYGKEADRPGFSNSVAIVHAALILLSYGAFGLSCIAGFMYVTQEHNLKFHKLRAVLSILPPIQRLEKIISRLLFAGFILLTIGLSMSPFLLKQKYNAYFVRDPKLLWSIFVWVLYFSILLLHGKFGGRRFAWGAIGSFVFVLLTFWGVNLLSPAHQ
jgi:HemX protein